MGSEDLEAKATDELFRKACMEEQIFNTDDCDLFYKDIGNVRNPSLTSNNLRVESEN